jgi:hypothetical protein
MKYLQFVFPCSMVYGEEAEFICQIQTFLHILWTNVIQSHLDTRLHDPNSCPHQVLEEVKLFPLKTPVLKKPHTVHHYRMMRKSYLQVAHLVRATSWDENCFLFMLFESPWLYFYTASNVPWMNKGPPGANDGLIITEFLDIRAQSNRKTQWRKLR